VPDAIVCSSASAAAAHEDLGYPHERMTVVPNGVDTDLFRPDPGARARLCDELGIPVDTQLIGMAARFSPPKDHRTFLRAASRFARERPRVRFLLCGREMTAANSTLAAWLARDGLEDRVDLLGVRDDMPTVHAALDIATLSSSWSETAPLAISEAMACGVPCVTTAVGDMPRMVADSGLSVAPRDPRALSDAWLRLLDESEESRQARGRAARRQVERDYSLSGMLDRYATVYGQLIDVA
jgi:glycosyltransferase involved in cell wall biosynthesis